MAAALLLDRKLHIRQVHCNSVHALGPMPCSPGCCVVQLHSP